MVKSHGGADGEGFASALGLAYVMAQSDFMAQIRANLDKFASFEEQEVAAAS